jgi:hypothetical protein
MAVAAVMMVLGSGRSGTTSDAAPGPEMINGSLIGAQGMRAVLCSGKGCVGNRHGGGTELRGVTAYHVAGMVHQEVGRP